MVAKKVPESNNFFYDDILTTILSIQIEDLFLTLCLSWLTFDPYLWLYIYI